MSTDDDGVVPRDIEDALAMYFPESHEFIMADFGDNLRRAWDLAQDKGRLDTCSEIVHFLHTAVYRHNTRRSQIANSEFVLESAQLKLKLATITENNARDAAKRARLGLELDKLEDEFSSDDDNYDDDDEEEEGEDSDDNQ